MTNFQRREKRAKIKAQERDNKIEWIDQNLEQIEDLYKSYDKFAIVLQDERFAENAIREKNGEKIWYNDVLVPRYREIGYARMLYESSPEEQERDKLTVSGHHRKQILKKYCK